jgi:phosphoribosylformylglycinamidine (FGAM) synthase-like enzyme
VAVIAQSHFGLSGAATAIGEQPVKMLVDPAAGARMAVGEALTNVQPTGCGPPSCKARERPLLMQLVPCVMR